MRAMVLAAGLGRRLLPLTSLWPKCLMPVGDQPLLLLALLKLFRLGAINAVVNTHHLAPHVASFLNRLAIGLPVIISHELELLGTGGALVRARAHFKEDPLWLINADIWCDADLSLLGDAMERHSPIACLGMVNDPRFNSVAVDDSGRLLGVRGYAALPQGAPLFTYSGLGCLHPRLLDYLPVSGPSNLVDAWHRALAAGETIICLPLAGQWNDLGAWQDLWRANCELAMAGEEKILMGPGAVIDRAAQVRGFCFMGEHCLIEAGALVKNSLLLPGAKVSAGARVENAILGKDFVARGVLSNGAFA